MEEQIISVEKQAETDPPITTFFQFIMQASGNISIWYSNVSNSSIYYADIRLYFANFIS